MYVLLRKYDESNIFDAEIEQTHWKKVNILKLLFLINKIVLQKYSFGIDSSKKVLAELYTKSFETQCAFGIYLTTL